MLYTQNCEIKKKENKKERNKKNSWKVHPNDYENKKLPGRFVTNKLMEISHDSNKTGKLLTGKVYINYHSGYIFIFRVYISYTIVCQI